jgi:tetratricopeptide (TPR) repeat protein
MRQIGDRRGEGNTLGNRGLVHWTLGEYSKALAQLRQSHNIFQEIGFKKGQAVTLGNLGVAYQKFGQHAEALRCYEKALALRREIHDRAGEGHDIVNIGVTYRHLGDFEKAIQHLEVGKSVAREVGSAYLLAESLNCLGIVYRKMGETDFTYYARAQECAEEALSLAVDHKLIAGEIKALSNLGRVYWLQGEKAKGLQTSGRAMALLEGHGSGVEGSEEDAYVNHYTLLSEAGRGTEAREVLGTLVRLIRSRAEKIQEKEYRRSFLEDVRQNRFALEEWRTHAG